MTSLDDLLARPVTFNGITQGYKPSYPIDNSDSKLNPLRKPAHLSNEMIRVSQLVQEFNVNKSNAWIYLRSNYGEKITHSDLIRIAKIVSSYTGIKVSRDAKRRKLVLLKWFDENWLTIKPILKMVTL